MFTADGSRARVMLSGRELPATLKLRLVHPTRAGMDYTARLSSTGAGLYEGVVEAAGSGRWQVVLEDEQGLWRLSGEVSLPAAAPALLAARTHAMH